MICGSRSAFILAMMRAGLLRARLPRLVLDRLEHLLVCMVKGACQTCRSFEALPRPVSCWKTSFTSAQMSSGGR
jgi:hypothetical protein